MITVIGTAGGVATTRLTECLLGSDDKYTMPIREVPPIRVVPPIVPRGAKYGHGEPSEANMAACPNLKQLSDECADLIQSVAPRVGAVILGYRVVSGIRWRDELMIPAAEALCGAQRVEIRVENSSARAEVLATDLGTDIAVLRVPDLAPVAGGFSKETLRVGEAVAVLGGHECGTSAIWGSVRFAGPAWTSLRSGTIMQRLEIDVRFDPTFEGAAIVDMNGTIAAMAVPGPLRRVFGIPTETIERVVALVEKHGHLPQAYIGVRLQSLRIDEATRAQLDESPAESRRSAAWTPGPQQQPRKSSWEICF